jgi:hypothetical protein
MFEVPRPEPAAAIGRALGLKRRRAANAGSNSGVKLASAKRGFSGAPTSEKGEHGVVWSILSWRHKKMPETPCLATSPNDDGWFARSNALAGWFRLTPILQVNRAWKAATADHIRADARKTELIFETVRKADKSRTGHERRL